MSCIPPLSTSSWIAPDKGAFFFYFQALLRVRVQPTQNHQNFYLHGLNFKKNPYLSIFALWESQNFSQEILIQKPVDYLFI